MHSPAVTGTWRGLLGPPSTRSCFPPSSQKQERCCQTYERLVPLRIGITTTKECINGATSITQTAMMRSLITNNVTRRGRKHLSLLPPLEEIFAEGVFFKLNNEPSSLSRSSTVASDLKGLAEHNESTCLSSPSSSSYASPACSAPNSWRSTDTESFILRQPLMVSNPDQEGESELVDNEAEKLGEVMRHSQKLPGTWYFSSNHVMVRNIVMKGTLCFSAH